MIAALRILFVLSGVTALALSTILFSRYGRPLANSWWRRFAAPGHEPPALLMDPRVQRTWGLIAGVGNHGIAWYLGTPAGATLMGQLFGAHATP